MAAGKRRDPVAPCPEAVPRSGGVRGRYQFGKYSAAKRRDMIEFERARRPGEERP